LIFGSDVFGRSVLGQIGNNAQIILQAGAGSFTITGTAATFSIKETAAAGAFAWSGFAAPLRISLASGAGTFAYGGFPALFAITEAAGGATFTITGFAANEPIVEPAGSGSFAFTFPDASLDRTGFDYEFQQGGIGHTLLAIEEGKKLAAITKREIPPPVDRRTVPTFRPVARPPAAPIAPAVDMAAIQKQRMDEAAAATRAAKKRRDEEAILLLAS
jgi:hypothetical protein